MWFVLDAFEVSTPGKANAFTERGNLAPIRVAPKGFAVLDLYPATGINRKP